jgi:uncharacterized protein
MTTVNCPTCGKPVEWTEAARWRPFCSERCRLIDLGEWISESHRIPGEPVDPSGAETTPPRDDGADEG